MLDFRDDTELGFKDANGEFICWLNTGLPEELRQYLLLVLKNLYREQVEWTDSEKKGLQHFFNCVHYTYYNRCTTQVCGFSCVLIIILMFDNRDTRLQMTKTLIFLVRKGRSASIQLKLFLAFLRRVWRTTVAIWTSWKPWNPFVVGLQKWYVSFCLASSSSLSDLVNPDRKQAGSVWGCHQGFVLLTTDERDISCTTLHRLCYQLQRCNSYSPGQPRRSHVFGVGDKRLYRRRIVSSGAWSCFQSPMWRFYCLSLSPPYPLQPTLCWNPHLYCLPFWYAFSKLGWG